MKIMLAGVPPWIMNYNEKFLFKEDLPTDSHLSAMINTIKRTVNVFELMFATKADIETFLANIKTLNLAGSMTLEIQTTSVVYFKWDGSNSAMEVNCPDIKGVQILALGGGNVFMIPQVIFEQTGAIA